MAAFLNNCRFIPAAGATTDWVYASTVGGCQSPTLAGAIDGRKYKFIAISADLTQWEIAEGAYTAASSTFARATVLYNSSGSGTAAGQSGAGSKISFTAAPNVAIVGVKEDLISIEEANAFTAAQMAQARANIGVMKRNYLINGGMMVSQENGSTAGTTNGYYPVDQWVMDLSLSGGAVSVAQVAVGYTPAGSPNRIRVTVTTAQASMGSGYCILRQPLEGQRIADLMLGTSSAKQIVVMLGVKGPAGTYGVQLPCGDFTSSAATTITISAAEANTPLYKFVTFQPTSGNYTVSNSAGAHLQITLAQATQFNLLGTVGNVFELFDVGLYEGSVAPAFQVQDYASELRECLRHYYKGLWTFRVNAVASGIYAIDIPFKVPMRAAPTALLSGTSRSNLASNSFVNTDIHQTAFQITASAAGDTYVYGETLVLNARL